MAEKRSWLDRVVDTIFGSADFQGPSTQAVVPDWRSSGWGRGVMDATLEDLEEGRPIRVARDSQPVLMSHAAHAGRHDARELLEYMHAERVESVAELMGREELASSSAGAGRLMWTYAVRNRHANGRSILERAGFVFPRSLLEEDEDEVDDGFAEFLYLMLEEGTDPPICKIGMTTKQPSQRERELNSSTSQHRRIRLVRYWSVANCREAEADVFRALSAYRVNDRREFFAIHPAEASAIIDRMIRR